MRKVRYVKQKEETNFADPEFGKYGDPGVAEENNQGTVDDDEGNEDNARNGKSCVAHFSFLCSLSSAAL